MNGLIQNRAIFSDIRSLTDRMACDKSAAVRELAAFLSSRIDGTKVASDDADGG